MGKYKTLSSLISIMMLLSLAVPTLAQPSTVSSTTEKKLTELTNRFTSLESNWGRFQMGGNLSVESNTYLDKLPDRPTFNFEQHLDLFLDAYIQNNLMFSLKTSHDGAWGVNWQSLNSPNYPMTTPFQVEEAFVRLEYPSSLNYFGRFRFSTSPIGLISDFFSNPIEGVALQKSFADHYHIIGIYSRVNTEYSSGTDQVVGSEGYFAARLGWSNQNVVWGINLVPDGITGEKAFSFDASFTQDAAKLSAELAWYSFHWDPSPDYQVDWTPGFLISYGQAISKDAYIQVKAAYLASQFVPSYSSLAHRSGTDREWFTPNSKGIELSVQNRLGATFILENRVIALTPVINYDQPDLTYHWRGSLIKSFSPVNQLAFGLDVERNYQETLTQAFLSWNMSF